MNMINYLSKNSTLDLIVVTNKKLITNSLLTYVNLSENVKIYRPVGHSEKAIARYLNYFLFYAAGLFLLIWHRPKIVFYFETLSSWPALIYKKIKGKRTQIMVHYHEYTEPELYNRGMILSRWMHGMESKMYKKFSWISHTNPVRLQMFKDDNHLNEMPLAFFHVIPNYPSESWRNFIRKQDSKSKVKRLVFVGSLGYDNMYLQEVIDWVGNHPDEFSLDVYSYNIDTKAKQVLENNGFANIKYCGGCDYQKLPEILKYYDIGLDIYKPFALNHVYGVSNKIFEYLSCGLDVWFSVDKPQSLQFRREDVFPKMLPVNFKELNSFDYLSAISREGLVYKPSSYCYENVYPEILSHISNDGNGIEA